MLDIQFIRNNAELVQEKANQKQVKVNISDLLRLDSDRRELTGKIEALRAERNQIADALKGGNPSQEQIKRGREVKHQVSEAQALLEPVENSFLQLLKKVPNIPTDDVPIGASEEDNTVSKQWGEKPQFDFDIKNHAEIAEARGWLDKERGAKVAGSRFVYLKGDMVLLEFALWQFALSKLTDESVLKQIIEANNLNISSKPFVPVLPPAVAKKSVFEATGRLNKEEQTYKLEDEDLWLNASAEHTMAPMYMGETISEAEFPLRYVGYTTAFRREAGTYGKDMEGIIRLHQFNKLEMESFNLPEDSLQEHFFLIAIQEYLMQQLGLPYQVLLKCTADIGNPNARGVDIEVWLPGQNKYRETHTADYITDYQARRMQTKVRRSDGSVQLVHTNDATAFSQRPLAGILENYQNADGTVRVPDVLQSYMGGRTVI